MDYVVLRTGKSVAGPIVASTMMLLERFATSDPGLLFDLVDLCNDGGYKVPNHSKKELQTLALLASDGRVRDDVKEIVLAATEGEGTNLTLVSPYKEP